MKKHQSLFFICFSTLVLPCAGASLNTAFTYQGRLNDGTDPADGSYVLRFAVYDSSNDSGTIIAGPLTNSVLVANGLFTTQLDFGAGGFTGQNLWLEIAVRTSGSTNSFTTLTPRQALTPSPYALFARNAATANGVATSAVSTAQLNTPGPPATGEVLSFNGGNLVWTNASTVVAAWRLGGNSGTIAGLNFLGTTDYQPLEIGVYRGRALRLEPTPSDANHSNIVNVVGGSSMNFVLRGVYGATIAGGGAANFYGNAVSNSVSADFGTIGGGLNNTIEDNNPWSTISGGCGNTIQSGSGGANICGGQRNTIQQHTSLSTIGGGVGCTIGLGAAFSFIGAGQANTVEDHAERSTIGGGQFNKIRSSAWESTIGGGFDNTIGPGAIDSTIAGGQTNTVATNASFSVVSGGISNAVHGIGGTVGGGLGNQSFAFSTIAGGFVNAATNLYGTVPGGRNNIAGGAGDARFHLGTGKRPFVADLGAGAIGQSSHDFRQQRDKVLPTSEILTSFVPLIGCLGAGLR